MSQTVAYQEGKHNTITAVVDHVMFKKTLPESWFQWFLEMGLWHLRELKLDVFQDVKRGLYPVTDRKTVVLDPCFVDWVIVGAKVGQYYVAMGLNDKLNLLDRSSNSSDVVAGLLSQNLPNGLNSNSYTGYNFNYNGSALSFVSGFHTKGSFRVHNAGKYKELILDYDYPHDHVYMEWITDGFEPCGETLVDPYFCDYLRKCMEFEWEQEKEPNRTESSIRRRGAAMEIAMAKVRGRKNDLDPQTLLNISRAQTRLTAKI
jgi:hypothetical protein